MKIHSRTLAFAVSTALLAPAYAVQITDYTELETLYEEAYVTGSFSSKSGNQDQSSYDGNLAVDYERNLSSRERNMNIDVYGDYYASRGGSDGDETEDTYFAEANFTMDNYLQGRPNIFWYGSADAQYEDAFDEVYLKVGAGAGYGRVTVATPMAYAIRIVEELQDHNAISTNVSTQAYLDLAHVVNRRSEFRSRYGAEEYEAEFLTALENSMKNSGIAPNGLNAAAISHMRRVLFDENINIRKYGWLVRGGLGVVVNDFNGESGDPSIDLGFEYAKPIGLSGQFIDELSYSAIWVDSDTTNQKITNRMSYTHELSDRIDWVNRWTLSYDIADGDNSDDILTNDLSSTFRYYLTNRLNLDFTVGLSHVEDDVDDNGNDDVDVTTFLGVRYRLR